MSVPATHISQIIADLMVEAAIKVVFGSPGSRNLPLLSAFERNRSIDLKMIIDERSSAFTAVGFADVKLSPIALCCTSGSAILNYAPALAEAYYRNIPLLVIAADRPINSIDNGEPQTIRQTDAISFITSATFEIYDTDSVEEVGVKVNKALDALILKRRPVLLNVRFSEPFDTFTNSSYEVPERTQLYYNEPQICQSAVAELAKRMERQHVLVYIGQLQPDARLRKAIKRLSAYDNTVIAAESISNLSLQDNIIYDLDARINHLSPVQRRELSPDILITAGGSPVGRRLRNLISENTPKEIWRVGEESEQNSLFGNVTRRIISTPASFFHQLALAVYRNGDHSPQYRGSWQNHVFINQSADSQLIHHILDNTPKEYNIIFSNGLTVRDGVQYPPRHHRYAANRGVSGIDGTTSSAIGATAAYSGKTLLISGDMSAFYDLSAFTNPLLSPRFKMIVIDNNGGGIFRKITPCKNDPTVEKTAACSHLDFNIEYYATQNFKVETIDLSNATDFGCSITLLNAVKWLYKDSDKAKLLIIKTKN